MVSETFGRENIRGNKINWEAKFWLLASLVMEAREGCKNRALADAAKMIRALQHAPEFTVSPLPHDTGEEPNDV